MVNLARTVAAAGIAVLAGLLFLGTRSDPQSVVYLQQGWSAAQRQNFYYMTQGTVIMPESWLLALRSPDGQPFMSRRHMERLGFIYDDSPSIANANGWPIGFAIGSSPLNRNIPTVGLTCAACHTSNISYRGTVIRIDGGAANIDLDRFKEEITKAMLWTGSDSARRAAFELRAVRYGFPATLIVPAFAERYKAAQDSASKSVPTTLAGPGRNDALAVIARVVFNYDIGVPANTNRATAPVNFPYLWNIWNFSWVQYNGSVRQPMGRNIGEALGVGATTNIIDPKTGNLNPESTRWKTSIPVRNLAAIENQLQLLQPPPWPASVLGQIDRAKAARGRALFAQDCASCHAVRALAGSPNHEWSVKVIPLKVIATDPRQAENFAQTTYDGTKLGLPARTTAAVGLMAVTSAVRTQAYRDEKIPESQWPEYDGFGRKNIAEAPCGYKARPLVGVWATPPFLHNGSVPSVFDLLSDTRPSRFRVGSTEYDPVRLGFVQASGPDAMTIDTAIVGNSNAGHWFTNDRTRPGRIGPLLSDAQKYDIIEYLKAATYADYPRVVVKQPDPLPCVSAYAASAY